MPASPNANPNRGDAVSPPRWTLSRWLAEHPFWPSALVFAAVLAIYYPALHAGFIWDDDGHVTKPALFPLRALWQIWFEPGATQQYYPALHSAFWFEHRLWGDNAFAYHLLNILLHTANACIFARVLRKVSVPGAWIAALLFAVHPVCVESVAWISEQKNTLSLLLYLLAALAYFDFDDTRRSTAYVRSSVFFALAVATKTVTATLPAALLVSAWWRRGRIEWRRDVLPLVPWFALGLIGGLFTARVERILIGADGAEFAFSPLARCLIAGRVVWFYLGKLLWPAHLVFVYPRWAINAREPVQYLFPVAAVVSLGWLAWIARKHRGPLAVALLFGGGLFPALGFVNVYPFLFSFVADHFQYLASLAIFAAAGAIFSLGARPPSAATVVTHAVRFRVPTSIVNGALILLLAALGTLTFRETPIYRDDETLFATTIARNPAAWMAHNNLGDVYAKSGRPEQAIAELQEALRWRPNYPEAESNLGDQLTQLGRAEEALPHLQHALTLRPRYAGAHNNLGIAYMVLRRPRDGVDEFRKALEVVPRDTQTHYNLAMGLAAIGQSQEAQTHFIAAAGLDTSNPNAHLNIAVALTMAKRFDLAFHHFEAALALQPDSAELHAQYGRSLAVAGKLDLAIAQFRAAVQLQPDAPEFHAILGQALHDAGQAAEAEQESARAATLTRR